MAKNVEFDILARDRASKTFDHVGKSANGLASKMGSLGKGALLGVATGGALAAVAGIAALGTAMVQGVKDAASYQKLANETAAVLKSTGNASHQSVKGIQARAAALESLSGVDEETIIHGQNVLATFTNIQDRVGKGNQIFSGATTAALNMSSALGTDLQGASIQVGKALNNPIKGVAALQRVGVSFTDAQKKQIKTLVASGKTMEAQKLILKELGKEFGGAAKAAGQGFEGSMARAKDAVQDAFRAIGMKLLPVLTKVADYVATHAGPFIDGFSKVLGRIWSVVSPGLKALSGWFTNTGLPAIQKFGGWIKNDLWPAIQKGYQTIMPALKQALSIVKGALGDTGKGGENFGKVIKAIGHFIVDYLVPILATLISKWLPIVAHQMQVCIVAVRLLWKALEVLATVVANVAKFMLRKFADVADMFSILLRAMSHVPGFGWAADAAKKLQAMAAKARDAARAIDSIQRNVTVGVSFHVMTGRIKVGNQQINVGMRAAGGPIDAGSPYIVGERGPEMIVPKHSGTVIPAGKTAAMRAAGGDTYVFNISGVIGNEQAVADKIHTLLLAKQRRSGTNLGLA